MKVAVVGDTGYIGGYLLKRMEKEGFIKKIIKIGRGEKSDIYMDLCEPEKMDYAVLNNIDFLIFTAAVSNPDKCSNEYDLSYAINVIGTKYFIQNALEKGCKVLFFSSDAVFGDIPGYVYTEISDTNPKTAYGKMKKNIEDCFRDNESFKTIRLPYVISANDRFISYCLKCIRNNEIAEVFHPFYRNCVSVNDVVDAVLWMIQNWEKCSSNVINVAGDELVSRVRIADEINRHKNNKLRYVIQEPPEGFYNNRPPITQMQSIYVKEYKILSEESFTEKIKRELEDIVL